MKKILVCLLLCGCAQQGDLVKYGHVQHAIVYEGSQVIDGVFCYIHYCTLCEFRDTFPNLKLRHR